MSSSDGDSQSNSSITNQQSPSHSQNVSANDPPKKSILSFQTSNEVNALAKKYRTEIAASTSSILSTTATFPLDFVKSRMQSYRTSFVATVKDAYKAEGLRAFWRGVFPPLISITLVRTISFSLYQKSKYALDHTIHQMTGESPLMIANAPGSYPTWSTLLCFGAAGATAGAVITSISCPFELTKLNEQLAGKMARDAAEAMKKGDAPGGQSGSTSSAAATNATKRFPSSRFAYRLVKEKGIRGLYTGFGLHMLRDTIGTSIYFMTYESAKQLMGNARGKSATSPYAVAIAGGLCGIVSWMIIYPIDVAKTVYQKAAVSSGAEKVQRPVIKVLDRQAYRGLLVSVVRSCIINMIFFSNFEFVKKRVNALEV
ncbi:Mitochondrial arginine transporter BAC2 [Lecanosticta acicola]|uniref:Mitochondrial arginine transporter BAC2 n=1 Tax=Lecanosticta acicola TaxID=111012 RepID=A0AAI8YYP9_9PEZI|nr:Mitochondrial arginine transporter BAC2 [Lecanosticta acicola]